MNSTELRTTLVERLKRDLVGPDQPEELIADRPSDRYLTGILFPRQMRISADEDDELGSGEDDGNEGASDDNAVPLANCIKPASMGMSFAVSVPKGEVAEVRILFSAARYVPRWLEAGGKSSEKAPDDPKAAREGLRWKRLAPKPFEKTFRLEVGDKRPISLASEGFSGLAVFIKTSVQAVQTVTIVVINEAAASTKDRNETEQNTWFQTALVVTPLGKTSLVPRDLSGGETTKDDQTAALIYRDAQSYAVGHTCSASWTESETVATALQTEWIPTAVVPAVSPDGDAVFSDLSSTALKPLSAEWLGRATDPDLVAALRLLPAAWKRWAVQQQGRISGLPTPALRNYAREHEKLWNEGIARINRGIGFLEQSVEGRDAFRYANRAMVLQRKWVRKENDLTWRPFQLAFQLLSLESLLNPASPDRTIADLLWFPTGGGKTEAYLGAIALLLFHRRLRPQSPKDGGGVNVIMRYTLRVLTTQQFERAAAMIAAADMIRAGEKRLECQERFRLGLWIGGDVRPKTVLKAHANPEQVMDLKRCPCCGKKLAAAKADQTRFELECLNVKKCELAQKNPKMPVWTVDEDIYREPPSLLIGTVDKFAQIARNPNTGTLFGIGTTHRPPDLVIQDELHLISGPLGTVAGLYEVAIDEMSHDGASRPKIIGSTATIKMADDQVRSLFMRTLYQFPPPGIDASNSCFAVQDDSKPGRLYLGVTTAGRSAKFALQAVCASLLQAASQPGLPPELEDAFWTLVAYFNSLRELGGAHVLMLDDVPKSVGNYAARHGETPRKLREPEELTSRRSQQEIPRILADLAELRSSGIAPDSLLATNMISVGVDIPRLALMVVNGQPKMISEYIQATSRVGRDKTPGLVVTMFNSGKPRDRSYYESFCSWHATLYRSVEPTSVTPFAPRAVDRALRAVLAAMARHLVMGMDTPRLSSSKRTAVQAMAQAIVQRCNFIDKEEKLEVDSRIAAALDEWEARAGLRDYWHDYQPATSLLISAERNAQLQAAGKPAAGPWPAPNSMRTVEPTTPFRLI